MQKAKQIALACTAWTLVQIAKLLLLASNSISRLAEWVHSHVTAS